MKIAVVGSGGFLAGKIIEAFEKKINDSDLLHFGRKEKGLFYLDLEEPEKFDYSVLDGINYILFTAAVSSPEACERDFKRAHQINVIGTRFFIDQAIKRKCRVLFFSSDSVFGFTDTIVDENSKTVGDTAYGRMKKEIEDQFKDSPFFKAIRLSYVFSNTDKYSLYLRQCMDNKLTAEIFHPFYRNCITDYEVIEMIEWLIQNWNHFDHFALNAGGTELVSRLRIADEWNRFYRGKLSYQVAAPPESFFEYRPKRLEMRSLYLRNILKEYELPFSLKADKIMKYNMEEIK